MSDSATQDLRSQQRARVSARLSQAARRLAAERGMRGFTVDQVCAEVGISRRTFFNYFPSKDDAVLGMDEQDDLNRLGEEFLSLGSRGWEVVVEDLVSLAIEHAERIGAEAREHADLVRALEREPSLLARFIGLTRERETGLARLIAEREQTTVDDPHVRAAVHVCNAVMRSTAESLTAAMPEPDFPTTLRESVAAMRAVLPATIDRTELA